MRATDSNITSIFHAVEFIEHNLKENITVADIADAVFYSLYHFCRMFNNIIHHTPYDYLMRRRLSESARDLIETDQKIIEIAFDYQFNSPEVYARAFKRMFNMQPNQWRKQRKILKRRLMPRLTLEHIQHINKGDYLKPVLEEKDSFHVAGLMTLVKDDKEQVISQLWGVLLQELEDIKERDAFRTIFNPFDGVYPEHFGFAQYKLHRGAQDRLQSSTFNYYGITWYPKDWEQRGVFYMAAIEITSPGLMNPTLVVKTIPALNYVRFIHKGLLRELHLSLDYIYHTWLPKSGKSLAYPLEIICHGQDFTSSAYEEVGREIYIPIRE